MSDYDTAAVNETQQRLEDEAYESYCKTDEAFQEWLKQDAEPHLIAYALRASRLFENAPGYPGVRNNARQHLEAILRDYTDHWIGKAQVSGRYGELVAEIRADLQSGRYMEEEA